MGFSGLSVSGDTVTYFALKKGFNAVSALTEISVGRLFLSSALYTGQATVVISDGVDSYEVESVNGYFPVYPFYSDPATISEITINVNASQYTGSVTITPSSPAYIDVNLTLSPDVIVWDNVQVDFRMPFAGYTLNQISNAYMIQIMTAEQESLPPFEQKQLTFNAGSNIANESNFAFGWFDRANVFLTATIDYTLDMGAFGIRNITEDIYIRFKE